MSTPIAHTQHPFSATNHPSTHCEPLAVEPQGPELLQTIASIESQLCENAARPQFLKLPRAPIRLIPVEILGEIFLSIPTSRLRPGNHQKSVCRLSLVCKRWRDAACLTPRLWSHMWVNAENPKLSFAALSAYTARAGGVPKEIEISSSCCGGVDWAAFCSIRCAGPHECLFSNSVFPKLLKRTPGTWRSISLNCPTPSCFRYFMESMEAVGQPIESNGWGSVQSFEVTASKWVNWMSPSARFALSVIPPSVTKLSLTTPPLAEQGERPYAVLAWLYPLNIPHRIVEGLTSLNLKLDAWVVMAPTALFETLQHGANLETLEIDLSGKLLMCHEADPLKGYFDQHAVSLPKLHRLHLLQISPVSLLAVKFIKAPMLLDLSISFRLDCRVDVDEQTPNFSHDEDDTSAVYDGRALANIIRGDSSFPSPLQRLHLKNLFFFDGTLRYIIHDLHSLSHLQLEWVGLPGNADDFLDLINDGPTCLPQLKTMEITKLKYPIGRDIPHLWAFAEDRHINLKFSVHDRAAWEKDNKRYLYLTGYESESDDDC